MCDFQGLFESGIHLATEIDETFKTTFPNLTKKNCDIKKKITNCFFLVSDDLLVHAEVNTGR